MSNPSKSKGTSRETGVVNEHTAQGLEAHRDENNSASSDVVVRTRAGIVRVEVKDRQRLNAHKVMKEMSELYPDDFNTIWWHRTSKKPGNSRLSPDGPDLVHVPAGDWLQVVKVLDRVGAALDERYRRMAFGGDDEALIGWIAEVLPDGMTGSRSDTP